jgi:SHS family lactate transporter-like MFS transporter
MESIPARWRGPVSGLLQAGYPSGYLLASILYFAVPVLTWRGMFMVGALPALLVFYIRRNVPESPDWQARRAQPAQADIAGIVRRPLGLGVYAVLMMTAFNFFAHGSQDIYPSLFLGEQHRLPHATISTVAIIYNIGAILGGLGFGTLSQFIGRRAAIVTAVLLSLPVLPLWAFSSGPVMLGLGAFLMQICVQGAWGVVPAHLNELSPPEIRGTFPDFTYQLGNLLAAGNATIQTAIAERMHHDYRFALVGVVGTFAVMIALLVGFGPEARHARMGREVSPAVGPAPEPARP